MKSLKSLRDAIESARLALEFVEDDSAFLDLCLWCQEKVTKARELLKQEGIQ